MFDSLTKSMERVYRNLISRSSIDQMRDKNGVTMFVPKSFLDEYTHTLGLVFYVLSLFKFLLHLLVFASSFYESLVRLDRLYFCTFSWIFLEMLG